MSILECGRDLRIHYRLDGEHGPLLLLFNGAGLPLTFWGSLATRLAQYCRVLRFDQRNAGRTEFEGNFSLLDTAADAASCLIICSSKRRSCGPRLGRAPHRCLRGTIRIEPARWCFAGRAEDSLRVTQETG